MCFQRPLTINHNDSIIKVQWMQMNLCTLNWYFSVLMTNIVQNLYLNKSDIHLVITVQRLLPVGLSPLQFILPGQPLEISSCRALKQNLLFKRPLSYPFHLTCFFYSFPLCLLWGFGAVLIQQGMVLLPTTGLNDNDSFCFVALVLMPFHLMRAFSSYIYTHTSK